MILLKCNASNLVWSILFVFINIPDNIFLHMLALFVQSIPLDTQIFFLSNVASLPNIQPYAMHMV